MIVIITNIIKIALPLVISFTICTILILLLSDLEKLLEKYEIGKNDSIKIQNIISISDTIIIICGLCSISGRSEDSGISNFVLSIIFVVSFFVSFSIGIFVTDHIKKKYPEDEPFIKKETKEYLNSTLCDIHSFYYDYSKSISDNNLDDSYKEGFSKMYRETCSIIRKRLDK